MTGADVNYRDDVEVSDCCSTLGPMDDDEKVRRTVHLILDAVSVGDVNVLPGFANNLAGDLFEVGAIEVREKGDTDVIDPSILMTAVTFLTDTFVRYAAGASGQDRLSVIGLLRDGVDEAYPAAEPG